MHRSVDGRSAALNPHEHRLIGGSRVMCALRERIERLAPYSEPVLVVGETGTGKELVARALHSASPRSSRLAQVIHCAAVGDDLLAAELFGHGEGAFTGAAADRAGRIRAGDGSTVVLDEITETPDRFQAALLRVIEYGEVQPVGLDRSLPVDVRFVATTNRPLEKISDGEMLRPDLYHRLAGFVIEVPALRDHREDIPDLTAHFLDELSHRYGAERRLDPRANDLLGEHTYPGNVRELRQVVTRAYVEATGEVVTPSAVERALRGPECVASETAEPVHALEKVIRHHIRRTLELAEGNLSHAARLLEIPRSTLQHYLVKYRVAPTAERSRREAVP